MTSASRLADSQNSRPRLTHDTEYLFIISTNKLNNFSHFRAFGAVIPLIQGVSKTTEQIRNCSQFRKTACGIKFLLYIDSLSTHNVE